jgi:hypothetical protein
MVLHNAENMYSPVSLGDLASSSYLHGCSSCVLSSLQTRLWVPHAVARSGPQTSLHVTSAAAKQHVGRWGSTRWAVELCI